MWFFFVVGVVDDIFDEFQPPNDSNPHDNTLCTKFISVSYEGKSISAEVVERYASPPGETDLILSASAFEALTGQVTGVVEVEWHF